MMMAIGGGSGVGKSKSNMDSYANFESRDSRNSRMSNNYTTNYAKFKRNAPGAEVLNKEYELRKR